MSNGNVPANIRAMRKRYYIDPKVQGGMLLRVLMYWACCLVSVTAMIIIWRIVVSGPARPFWTHFDELWFLYKPVAVASLLLIPMLFFDVIRFSHRFVGPMYRLRNCMSKLAKGEDPGDIRFRTKDFWQDYAESFNTLRQRLLAAEARAARLAGETDQAGIPADEVGFHDRDTVRIQREALCEREQELVAV